MIFLFVTFCLASNRFVLYCFNYDPTITTGLPDAELGPVNGVEGSEDGMEVDQQKRGVKRPGADHESDDESSAAPPVNDIYRSRQQKRVH